MSIPARSQDEVAGWNLEALLDQVKDPEMAVMLKELARAPAIYQPSEFWKEHLQLHIRQLQDNGLERFKTTVNQNYFNWTGGELKDQKGALLKVLDPGTRALAWLRGWCALDQTFKPPAWSGSVWHKYLIFLHLLWCYTDRQDRLGWLRRLQEPLVGHPFTIQRNGRYISQDICNSLLEINAALEAGPPLSEPIRCAELGAGYGRVAYCMLQQHPKIKYVIIDIPPALHVAQWYLPRVVPGRKVFQCRPFTDFESVRPEFEAADLAFVLPHQAALLPDKYFDLFLNISSLHEMTHPQIQFWFRQIGRLCRRRFYFKQWLRFENRLDKIIVRREDYPVPDSWREVYNRPVVVQPRFFEALYDLEPSS